MFGFRDQKVRLPEPEKFSVQYEQKLRNFYRIVFFSIVYCFLYCLIVNVYSLLNTRVLNRERYILNQKEKRITSGLYISQMELQFLTHFRDNICAISFPTHLGVFEQGEPRIVIL